MPTPIEAILTSCGSLVTSSVTWMGQFLATIVKPGNEILLIFVLLPLVGLGIGLVKRLLHV